MKTKLFFFFLLLVMGAGKGLSQDSLLVSNWDAIPGTELQKTLAIQNPGKWVQIADTIEIELGELNNRGIRQTEHRLLIRSICYDEETNKLLYREHVKKWHSSENAWLPPIIFLLMVVVIGKIDCILRNNPTDKDCRSSQKSLLILFLPVFILLTWFLNRPLMWGAISIVIAILCYKGFKKHK